MTEYLFRNEGVLDEVINTAIEDNTFRSDDLEFTFAARVSRPVFLFVPAIERLPLVLCLPTASWRPCLSIVYTAARRGHCYCLRMLIYCLYVSQGADACLGMV